MESHKDNRLYWLPIILQMLLLSFFPVSTMGAQEPPEPEVVRPREALPSGPSPALEVQEKEIERFFHVTNLDAYYNYSKQKGGYSTDGVGGSLIFSPGVRLNEKITFLAIYNGRYRQDLNFYSDLVGPRATDKYQGHTITPTLRINFGENSRYSLAPSFFYTTTKNKDVDGGGWDDGLYNYRDKGGSLDFTMRDLSFGDGNGTLRLGAQSYDRTYPNYTSLLDLATGLGIEEDVRDYDGLLLRAGYTWSKRTGFSWGARYYWLDKDLEDKKVVNSNGVLTGETQSDDLHNLSLSFTYTPENQSRLRLGLDLGFSLYDSNQNYYDGMGTWPQLDDDVFLENFYDFDSYRIQPNISYTFAAIPLTGRLSYAYQKLDYADRLAQDSDGFYKNDEQDENQQLASLSLNYNFSKNTDFYVRWVYLDVESNNDYTDVYQYDHEVNYFYIGITYRFQ